MPDLRLVLLPVLVVVVVLATPRPAGAAWGSQGRAAQPEVAWQVLPGASGASEPAGEPAPTESPLQPPPDPLARLRAESARQRALLARQHAREQAVPDAPALAPSAAPALAGAAPAEAPEFGTFDPLPRWPDSKGLAALSVRVRSQFAYGLEHTASTIADAPFTEGEVFDTSLFKLELAFVDYEGYSRYGASIAYVDRTLRGSSVATTFDTTSVRLEAVLGSVAPFVAAEDWLLGLHIFLSLHWEGGTTYRAGNAGDLMAIGGELMMGLEARVAGGWRFVARYGLQGAYFGFNEGTLTLEAGARIDGLTLIAEHLWNGFSTGLTWDPLKGLIALEIGLLYS